jgi:hypothetical protein
MDMLNAASGGIVAFANEGEVELDLEKEFAARQQYENFVKKQREAAGVGAPKAALGEFYTKEQAALADAESKNKGYNLMDIGFNLATQTGSLAHAAGKTGKETLPGIIAREEGLRGRRGEAAKGLAEVAEGERLMKIGDIAGGNAMFEKAQERISKEKIAGAKAPGNMTAYANNYLAERVAAGDKRDEATIRREGMNQYMNLYGAAGSRAATQAASVAQTGQNLTRDDANKEIATFGTPGNETYKARVKAREAQPDYKNLSPADKKAEKARIRTEVRDEIMAKNQAPKTAPSNESGKKKPEVIKLD